MANNNTLQEKAYSFALEIVNFCKKLNENKEYVLAKQLLRSGTSIGANIEEAQQAESRKDFISKFSIALKESYETRYWIKLIRDGVPWTKEIASILLLHLDEIIRLLVVSIKTSKKNLNKK